MTQHVVCAHYFPPYPIQLTTGVLPNDYYTKNYLAWDGEGGKHRAYGGLLRNRPKPETGAVTGDWALANALTEVQAAKDHGIDCFIVDILTSDTADGNNNSRFGRAIFRAASQPGSGLTTIPMLDISANLASLTAQQAAAIIQSYLNFPSTHRLPDGRPVFSAFLAEAWPSAKWADVKELLGDVAFVPCFNNPSAADTGSYDSVADGYSVWGSRSPASNSVATWAGRGSKVKGRGKLWMHPIAFQDARPNQGKYDEAANSATLATMWEAARTCDADWVQLITWNDHSECTAFSPTRYTGTAVLEMNRFYADWWRTGVQPPITKDKVVLTHRHHFVGDHASWPVPDNQRKLMLLRSGSTPARDTLEAWCLLTAPATLVLESGASVVTKDLPAGLSTVLAPLGEGVQKATLRRLV